MGYEKTRFFMLTLLGSTLLCLLLTTSLAFASKSPSGAFGARDARADVRVAEQHLERAEARLREARYVLDKTRLYGTLYGSSVGRWVWLARSEGFPRSSIGDVALLMFTESRGDPAAQNSALFSGLFQFGLDWWYGKWNPLVPRVSMHHAKKAWSDNGGRFYPDWNYPNL